jgi:hypothetical protein
MAREATVYLVGGPNAQKINSYQAMTNSLEEAQRLVQEIKGGTINTIKVRK